MADFPAIEPEIRNYDPGDFPLTESPAFGAMPIRFLHGSTARQLLLTLGYVYLNNTDAASIRTHYEGQVGSVVSFLLPNIIWQGHTSITDIAPTGTLWRYEGPPEEEHLSGGLFNVSVKLRSSTS
jgi:hypothetical protein